MKHRQRPQVHGVTPHAGRELIAIAHQRCGAVRDDDALGIARRARRVVERDRLPLVGRHPPPEVRIAFGEKRLVVGRAQEVAILGIFEIVDVDDVGLHLGERERRPNGRCELAIGNQDLGLAVVQHEGDDWGIEPRVDRMQYGAGHGDPVMRLQHRRGVRQHHRDRVAVADEALRQGRSEPPRAIVELLVGQAHPAVHDGRTLGMGGGCPFQQGERRQRREVRCVLVEITVVDAGGHGLISGR